MADKAVDQEGEAKKVLARIDRLAAADAADAEELGEKVAAAIQHGPTRPHPHTPPDPSVLKAAGPVVALVDKLRDAVTGRGHPG
jgi:hypothetical protein